MNFAESLARKPASRSAAERPRPAKATAQRAAVADTRPAAAGLAQLAAIVNPNGLPANLQAGIERLSGHSLADVRVHRNSSQPAQLNAHAFAQGRDIHLAPGQEKHLPHEAWHVVQQAQGRVKATTQLQATGTPINDDPALEHEADRMGGQAAQMKTGANPAPAAGPAPAPPPATTIQRVPWNAVIHGRDQAVENAQNARLGAGVVPLHPIAIGAQPDPANPAQTLGAQRHFDADLREQVAKILNYLPASHIVGNPALTRVVMERATPANPGISYFGGGQLHIVVPFNASSWVYMSMSKWPVGELATTPMTNIGYTQIRTHPGGPLLNPNLPTRWHQTLGRDVVGTGTIGNKLSLMGRNFVDWLLKHETGHSVDAAIGFVANRHYRAPAVGGWLIHRAAGGDTDVMTMRNTMLNALGLLGNIPELNAAFHQHTGSTFTGLLIGALNNRNPQAFNVPNKRQARNALEAGGAPLMAGGAPAPAVANGAWKAMHLEEVVTEGLNSPWQRGGSGGIPLGNRSYHVEFQHGRWVSYESAKYQLRDSNYQFSGPDEWFAETYAHYFTHSSLRLPWTAASATWGRKVKDPASRAWMRNNLDPINAPGGAALIAAATHSLVPIAPLPPGPGPAVVPAGAPPIPAQNAVAVPTMAARVGAAIGGLTATVLNVGASGIFKLLATAFLLPLGILKYLTWFPITWMWKKLQACFGRG